MAALAEQARIVIAGAGSIGCYVGACLALAGRDVVLLARPRIADVLARNGLLLTDLDGRSRQLAPGALRVQGAPECLAAADVVLVTVKSAATPEMAQIIAGQCRPGTVVVSRQNGIGNAQILAAALPGLQVVAGMVPFNVVQLGGGKFHRGSAGGLMIGAGVAGLAALLQADGLDCEARADMQAVQWGKLLLNLNNALNALAGIPLREQLQDRDWRRVLAAMMDEALGALAAAGIRPAKISRVAPRLVPHVLRLPTPLFRRVANAMLKIDPQARSSMWEDLQQGRATEVDYLQGAVVELARRYGRTAPISQRVMAAIHAAEAAKAGSPGWTAARLT